MKPPTDHDLWRRENLAKKLPPAKVHVPSVLDRPVVKLLRRLGWEPDLWTRKGIETWRRPHPDDVAEYPTRLALWIALTGRSRRGGWNAKGWSD